MYNNFFAVILLKAAYLETGEDILRLEKERLLRGMPHALQTMVKNTSTENQKILFENINPYQFLLCVCGHFMVRNTNILVVLRTHKEQLRDMGEAVINQYQRNIITFLGDNVNSVTNISFEQIVRIGQLRTEILNAVINTD